MGLRPAYKTVDTCAGEFPSSTPYLYSCWDEESEAAPDGRPTVIILGSGPNRIGQGVEFDYCCVRAALSFRELGYRTVMVNSNPETVSTDFDISDVLYFEPLTLEHVLEIVHVEKPIGVVVQLGGQTPLWLAKPLAAEAGVPIMGTHRPTRSMWRKIGGSSRHSCVSSTSASRPTGTADTAEQSGEGGRSGSGYLVLERAAELRARRPRDAGIVYDDGELRGFFDEAARVAPGHPVLIDSFLEDAFEADVDAICDGENVVIGGVMQHIEDAGIHSGDSACVLPPYLITEEQVEQMRAHTRAFAKALGVVGLINAQYAIKDGVVYCLEVNPRASRTVPFVSKTTGVPLASLAAAVCVGKKLTELGLTDDPLQPYVAVKEAVFPFAKFPGVDTRLGPEMRSTVLCHGDCRLVRHGVRKGAGERRRRATARGIGLRHGQRPRQADGRADCAPLPRTRLQDSRDSRDAALPARARRAGRSGAQGVRGAAECHRPDAFRSSAVAGQHPTRQTHAGR